MPRLLLATPEGQQVVELRAFNSLGRHPSNTIQLLDKIVSKEHCIVERRGAEYVLRDLGSLNGTYINGERVAVGGEQMLRHGDDIALGSTRARFDDGSGKPLAPPVWSPAPAPGAPGAPMTAAAPPAWQPAAPVAAPSAPPVSHQRPVPMSAIPATTPAGPGMLPQIPLSVPGPQSVTSPVQYQPYDRTPTLDDPESVPLPPLNATRVDMNDQSRAIGTQIAATQKGFLPYDQLASNTPQLQADYERLRLSHELSREIAMERDLRVLLNKILLTIFKFVRADRGVIFLRDASGELRPGASLRRDGTDSPISVSSTIMNHVIKERATVLTHDAAMDFAASKGKSMILNRISSAIVAPLLHNDEILGVLWLDSETLAQFQPKDMEIVTAIAAQAAMFIEINILGKKIEQEIVNRERFSRLLSPNIAQRVLSGELEVTKGGQLVQECTVFNSDIRGFTRMSEGAEPQVIVDMLNEYFEQMVEVLFKYEGTLDKFMGDGIMALWGAPVAHPDDATRSVACAIEQMEVLGRFNRERVADNQPPLGIGIGIHTGPLVAGYIGSSRALSYTVIGDVANTSARLCGIAAAGQILVSEQTLARLAERYEYEELPPAQLKGKGKPFRVFNVLGRAPAVQVPASVG
ncbi:MAG: FHA domain-containing protein [Polyangiaceae bacterium]|nr:FHA domain-containing protein [Polyangiaceae bacterium]MCL4750232.1 FHA domain-containing protein [Myxococcales bacterium]